MYPVSPPRLPPGLTPAPATLEAAPGCPLPWSRRVVQKTRRAAGQCRLSSDGPRPQAQAAEEGGAGGTSGLSHLVRGLQHLHEEGVDGRVPDELEEEEVLQALEADGAKGGQAQQQLGEPADAAA